MTAVPTAQCSATNRNGSRCGRRPVPGATVCNLHGGKAPQVRRKAALRLLELVDPAIATLAREMTGATNSADRQRAANSILDRAGIPRASISIDVDTAKALLVQRLLELRDMQDDETDVIEGTVIKETNEAAAAAADGVPGTVEPETAPAEPEGS